MKKKYIKIPKDFFKDINFTVSVPWKCKICGEWIWPKINARKTNTTNK